MKILKKIWSIIIKNINEDLQQSVDDIKNAKNPEQWADLYTRRFN